MSHDSIIVKDLFVQDGTKISFSIVAVNETGNPFRKVLKSNCVSLIKLCGGSVKYLDEAQPNVSGRTICLVLNYQELEYNEILEMQHKMKCEIFRLEFLWESVFAKKIQNLSWYKILPALFTNFDPNDLLKSSSMSWSTVRLRDGGFEAHNRACSLTECESCPSDSGEEFDEPCPDYELADLVIPDLFTVRDHGPAKFILLLDEKQRKNYDYRTLQCSMESIIQMAGGAVAKLDGRTNMKQDGYAIPITCISTGSCWPSLRLIQKHLKCDLFSANFIWESVFSQIGLKFRDEYEVVEENWRRRTKDIIRENLTNSRRHPVFIPEGFYSPYDVLKQRDGTSWKDLRMAARTTNTHTMYCTDTGEGCIADESCSDDESVAVTGVIPGSTRQQRNTQVVGQASDKKNMIAKKWSDEEVEALKVLIANRNLSSSGIVELHRKAWGTRSKRAIERKVQKIKFGNANDASERGDADPPTENPNINDRDRQNNAILSGRVGVVSSAANTLTPALNVRKENYERWADGEVQHLLQCAENSELTFSEICELHTKAWPQRSINGIRCKLERIRSAKGTNDTAKPNGSGSMKK